MFKKHPTYCGAKAYAPNIGLKNPLNALKMNIFIPNATHETQPHYDLALNLRISLDR